MIRGLPGNNSIEGDAPSLAARAPLKTLLHATIHRKLSKMHHARRVLNLIAGSATLANR